MYKIESYAVPARSLRSLAYTYTMLNVVNGIYCNNVIHVMYIMHDINVSKSSEGTFAGVGMIKLLLILFAKLFYDDFLIK